jgi:hypothetical protein
VEGLIAQVVYWLNGFSSREQTLCDSAVLPKVALLAERVLSTRSYSLYLQAGEYESTSAMVGCDSKVPKKPGGIQRHTLANNATEVLSAPTNGIPGGIWFDILP